MSDYGKLVKALRYCVNARDCKKCGFRINNNSVKCRIQRVEQAAAAIEGLQAEVERVKDSNKELRKRQTYIDRYGTEWLTSAEDVPNYAYEHGYADGMAEVKAQLPKRGEWVETEEEEWGIYAFKKKTCSVCDCKIDHIFMLACMDYFDDRDTVFHYCPNCGAKMEVQDGQK